MKIIIIKLGTGVELDIFWRAKTRALAATLEADNKREANKYQEMLGVDDYFGTSEEMIVCKNKNPKRTVTAKLILSLEFEGNATVKNPTNDITNTGAIRFNM